MNKWFTFGMIFSFYSASGQNNDNLKGFVQTMAGDVAKAYVAPVVSGFGSSLNSGWFHKTPEAKKTGFHFELGVVWMNAIFKKQDRTFSTTASLLLDSLQAAAITGFVYTSPFFDGLNDDQKRTIQLELMGQIRSTPANVRVSGGTAIGAKTDSIRIRYVGSNLTYFDPRSNQNESIDLASAGNLATLPASGLNILVGLPTIQMTLGTLYGTQLTVRFLPTISTKNAGKFSYFGWGFQHNPSLWLGKKLPFELAIALFSQRIRQGNFFEMKASTLGFTASKQLGKRFLNFTPYAGLTVEKSKMNFKYDYVDANGVSSIEEFALKGKDQSRLTIGGSIRFLIVNLNMDYSLARYRTFSVGLTVAL